MALMHSEMFANFVYDQTLTYNELLEREAELVETMQTTFEDVGGAHVEFAPTGDALNVQCLFAEHDEGLFHAVCDAVSPMLRSDVEGRILFVDRNLGTLHLYLLADGVWREGVLRVPGAREGLGRCWT